MERVDERTRDDGGSAEPEAPQQQRDENGPGAVQQDVVEVRPPGRSTRHADVEGERECAQRPPQSGVCPVGRLRH